ncbi:MAG: DUF4364 family protein, partial [Clostridia bacterium]
LLLEEAEMPFKSPERKISDAENRLRVLFCINALGMATLEQLWPFVAQLELLDYVPLCLYVDELVKDGVLLKGTHAVEGMLYLSEEGQKTLALFADKLPPADQKRIAETAPAYFTKLIEHRRVRAVHERAEEGSYRVACAVREGDLPTLLLKLSTHSRGFASTAIKRFSQCASQLLMLFYTLPAGKEAFPAELVQTLDLAMEKVSPAQPMLCTYGKHEHSAVVCLRDAEVTYRIALLMPSPQAAQNWADSALAHEAELAARVTAAFQKPPEGKRPPAEGRPQ